MKIYGNPVATPIDPDVVKTGLLIVTYDDEVEPWTASHSASEILAHLDKGGSVILQFPGNRFGHGYAQLHSVAFGNVVFCEVNMSVTPEILMYTVGDTKEVTVEVFTMNGDTTQENQLIVTLDDEVDPWQASHTAAQIIAHMEKGGGVILKQGTDDLISYAHLYGEFYGSVMFFDVNTTDNSTEMSLYTVHSTGEVTAEVFTMNSGTAQEEKGVNSYTVTRAGQTITMVLTLDDDTTETHVLALDENDYPTSITVNGHFIIGEWSGF